MNISKEDLEILISESNSKSEVCKKLNINTNGSGYKKLNELVDKYDLTLSSFRKSKNHYCKYETIIKKCPICGVEFKTKRGSVKEKTTCSYSCSNTYFRSGTNNANYINIEDYDINGRGFSKKYRKICFDHHEHKCIICNEKLLLDVHHFDGDKMNNKPENLIPMCATHHNYRHSRYRYLVEKKIVNYVNGYINKN